MKTLTETPDDVLARASAGVAAAHPDMAGGSLTICQLTPELTELRDYPVNTPAPRWGAGRHWRAPR
jgi:dihydroxyacetone kinase